MEPSAPPSDFTVTGIAVIAIIPVTNTVINGTLLKDLWTIKFTSSQKNNQSLLLIEVTFKWTIDNTRYVDHLSKTLFLINDLSLDHLQPADPRIEILAELGLTAIGHSRAIYSEYTLNSVETVVPPIMLFIQDIRKEVIKQLIKS